MKSNLVYICSLVLLSCVSLSGQDATDDFFRNTGKINTVLAVVLILFFVLIGYLVTLDRKLRKLEKHQKDEQ